MAVFKENKPWPSQTTILFHLLESWVWEGEFNQNGENAGLGWEVLHLPLRSAMEGSGKGSGAGTAEEKSCLRAVQGKSVSAPMAASLQGGLPEVTHPGVLPRRAQRVMPTMFPATGPSGVPLSRAGSPCPPPWLRRSPTFIFHPLTSATLQRSSPRSPPPRLLHPSVFLTFPSSSPALPLPWLLP